MERNNQKTGLVNWIILLAATVASSLVTRYVNSTAGWMGTIIFGIGFLVALVSYFQMRLEERERLEKLEFDELNKAKGSAALFAQEADTFHAQRSREQFERFFLPAFAIVLFLAECGAIYWQWSLLEKNATLPIQERSLVAASLYGLLFLVLFLLGKYSAGLSRLENQRLLRPAGGFLLLSAYVSLLLAGVIAASTWAGFPKADLYAARGLSVLLALVAAETLVGLILEIYRPRLKGKTAQLLYESRLVGLLGQPEGIFKTAAHALDYQFGFQVSETWFYKFLQKALAWIILAQLAILLLSTCFVFVETGEEALFERFGQPVAGRTVFGPGLHLKLPFPIDRVYRYRTEQVQSFVIGVEKEHEKESAKTILWSVAHDKEENMLVASRVTVSQNTTNETGKKSPPVSLLSVSIPVQFQITNLTAWAYNNEAPDELLEKLATREVVRYLVSADLNEIMSSGRAAASQVLRERIQAIANERELGASILFVGLQDIHPPVAVAADYEKYVSVVQASKALNLAAKAFSIETNALARATASGIVNRAEADRQRSEVGSLARVAFFTNQIAAYTASPAVFSQRAYLHTLSRASKNSRKYVIATTNTQDVILLNLEDKVRADLQDLTLPTAK